MAGVATSADPSQPSTSLLPARLRAEAGFSCAGIDPRQFSPREHVISR